MLSQLMNRPCILRLRSESGERDEYGDDVTTVTEVETVCEIQQQQRTEPADAAETSDTRWLLFLPAGTDITTGDSVEVSGHVYELVGDPWEARNPRTQASSHIEATARRVAGSEDAS